MAETGRRVRPGRMVLLLGMVAALLAAGALFMLARHPHVRDRAQREIDTMQPGAMRRIAAATLMGMAPGAPADAQTLPPPRPAVIGMNLSEVRYYTSSAPFANLLVGSEWMDSRWQRLPAELADADGNILKLPTDGIAYRFLLMPATGPEGVDVRCTFTGSGSLSVSGLSGPIQSGPQSLRFRLTNQRGKGGAPYLILRSVDVRRPPRDLDCRDARLDRTVRFRQEFLQSLRGYGVIRFMDWQNANENVAVTWRDRRTPSSLDIFPYSVAVEDMLALTRSIGAAPWFIMPWNADDEYITQFARLVRAQLPADQQVYVEVGNEVWNPGFSVSRQAAKEGLERKLSTDENEARMRRYAERTGEVMRLWETVFQGRKGLVRVLATQHGWPQTAETALAFRDTAAHVDALATAPYFGAMLPGTGTTRDSGVERLSTELTGTLKLVTENRRIAVRYGKRYIGYEGGQGLVLPAQVDLAGQLQHDPAMYDLYRRYLAAWRDDAGDVLCLFNNVSRPTSWGAWGLSAWEDETPAEAPKLRAVREFVGAPRP